VAGVNQYEGFIFSVIPHISPCYRCLYKDVKINRIVHQGVFGPTVYMLGAFQASEAIKLALDSKDVLINKMILINLYNNQLKSIILNKDSNCPVCGII
jgi:adenylyltransferase/sulfurtransferase